MSAASSDSRPPFTQSGGSASSTDAVQPSQSPAALRLYCSRLSVYLGGERLFWARHQGKVFRHQKFTYLNPSSDLFSVSQLQAHYAAQVSTRGTPAGFIEAHALGCLLGRQVVLYDHPDESENLWGACRAYLSRRGTGLRQLACLGPEVQRAQGPAIHLTYLKFGHFRSLVAQTAPAGDEQWQEVDAGGGGDCLYRSVAHRLGARKASAVQGAAVALRARTAQRIGTDLQFRQLVHNQTCNAFFEYQQAHAYARPGPMGIGPATAEHAHRLLTPPAYEIESPAHPA